MRVLPVALMSGSRRSAIIVSPTVASSPITRLSTPPHPWRWNTASQMRWVAMAVSGALREGFQIIVSPATAATIAFRPRPRWGS